jgi:dihydropteroate synthase
VMPILERLVARTVPVSIDTSKPEVARRAVEAGAKVVNDVTGLRNPAMIAVCAEGDAIVCIMHMQGDPRTMQTAPSYGDVVDEVRSHLVRQAECAQRAGIRRDRIWIDPGIGFGKTAAHNLSLLRCLDRLVATGYPVLVGVSRKSLIGRILGHGSEPVPVGERLEGTLAVQVLAQAAGVKIVRTHDVLAARRAVEVAAAVLGQP